MGEKLTTITVHCFTTNAQKKALNEFMRLHNYHASTRFKKDFIRTTSGTDYEKEQKFIRNRKRWIRRTSLKA